MKIERLKRFIILIIICIGCENLYSQIVGGIGNGLDILLPEESPNSIEIKEPIYICKFDSIIWNNVSYTDLSIKDTINKFVNSYPDSSQFHLVLKVEKATEINSVSKVIDILMQNRIQAKLEMIDPESGCRIIGN